MPVKLRPYEVVIEYLPTRLSQTKVYVASDPDDAANETTFRICKACCQGNRLLFERDFRIRSIRPRTVAV